jgi:predicted nucleic acid-binding protein
MRFWTSRRGSGPSKFWRRAASSARRRSTRTWPEIEAAIDVVHKWFRDVVPLTSATHGGAVALARDHGFAFCDELIVAAALEAECDTLYSEDMQHGRDVAGLTIVNPFAKPAR